MTSVTEMKGRIREVLEDALSSQTVTVDEALDRIMAFVDPFERMAQEELEAFRATFAELAR